MPNHQNKRARQTAVYTVPEFAARLKISRQHLLNLIEAGEINAINIGVGKASFYRIPITEVERYESARSTVKGGRK